MLGLLRPRMGWSDGGRAPPRWRCALASLLIAMFGAGSDVSWAGEDSLRLRIEWGGGAERRWQGSLAPDTGTLILIRSLGLDADEPGSIWSDERRVWVESPSGRTYDGLDAELTAAADATLRIALASDGQTAAPIDIPIAKLLDEPINVALDDRGNRLLVRRAPGDRLRVAIPRDNLVFAPGEWFSGETRPHQLNVAAGTKLRWQARLLGRNGRVAWTDERELIAPADEAWPPLAWSLRLPEEEGVYDLVMQLTRRTISDRFALRPQTDERRVQLVVVAPLVDRPDADRGAWQLDLLAEIDPASATWWERLTPMANPWPRVTNVKRSSLGNGQLGAVSHALGTFAQLADRPAGSEPAWEAFPLPVARPGQPHVLEIEFPADARQSLGLSVVEFHTSGLPMSIGLDSGVYHEPAAGEAPAVARHRLIFWPRTASPLALVCNHRPGVKATFGKIRLLGPKPSALSTLGREALPDGHLPRAFAPGTVQGERRLAAYFDRPMFPENFGAPQAFDPAAPNAPRPLDDWHTFFDGGRRMIEYLEHVGYNTLVLSVYADGGALYPSARLGSTPRYDDGAFFTTGQDAVNKDVMELIARLCDRQPMRFIPSVSFTAPLPELEDRKRRGGIEAAGLELLGGDGRSWAAQHAGASRGGAHYNPLHPVVQQAMLDVVREVAERCAEHRSFDGVALPLSPDGFAQLPGDEWGCDPDTLGRFFRDLKAPIHWSASDSWSQARALVAGEYRSAWLVWRAKELHAFHERLAATVEQARPGAKLYLFTADLLRNAELARQLRPSLPRKVQVDDVFLSAGIDPSLYRSSPSIVLSLAERTQPIHSLAEAAAELEARDTTRFASHGTALFFHPPLDSRVVIDNRAGSGKTTLRLLAQLSPVGTTNRQRFAHALAALDAQLLIDGGWLLPLGQEDELRDLIAVYRQLPEGPFETLPGVAQPVCARMWRDERRAFFYLVNDSPWKATVSLSVDAPEGCRLDPLGATQRFAPVQGNGARHELTLDLAPYDVVAGVFDDPRAQIANPRVRLPPAAIEWFDERIRGLWDRVGALKNPPPLVALANADFEIAALKDQTPAEWELSPRPRATVRLDESQRHGGHYSARLQSGPAGAELLSKPIPAPASGRMTLSVWLRVADAERQPVVRIGLLGAAVEGEYRPFALLGDAPRAQSLNADWTQYVFAVTDLPAGLTTLRARIDLSGEGTLWIDDVELLDLEFSDTERLELSKIVTLIDYKRKNGELADCARLLEGYWPRYLMATVPLEKSEATPKAGTTATVVSQAASMIEPERKPSAFERLKRFLPRWPR